MAMNNSNIDNHPIATGTDGSFQQQQPPLQTTVNNTNHNDATTTTAPPPPMLSSVIDEQVDSAITRSSNASTTGRAVVQATLSTSSLSNNNTTVQPAPQQQQQHLELWPADPNMYQLVGKIGQGAFATVWKAYRIVPVSGNATSVDDNTRDDTATVATDSQTSSTNSTTSMIATTTTSTTTCAVKVLNLDHADSSNLVEIRLEVQAMRLLSHPNVLTCHTAFVNDRNLWLITPFMAKGSSLHSLQSIRKLVRRQKRQLQQQQQYPNYNDDNSNGPLLSSSETSEPTPSLPHHQQRPIHMEQHIMYILHETLVGLQYIHEDNLQIHRDIKAGNILIDTDGTITIADFGVSSFLLLQNGGSLYQHEKAKTFVGTPCWMAPEVMEQVNGYDYKADIWSLGITALELAKGYAPYARYPPMKVLILTIQEDPPSLASYDVETGFNSTDDEYDDMHNSTTSATDGTSSMSIIETYSSNFEDFVRWCLQKDPAQRPTCTELLGSKHFEEYYNTNNNETTTTTRQHRMDAMRDEICAHVKDVGYKQEERNAAAAAAAASSTTTHGIDDATVMAGNRPKSFASIQQRVEEVEDRPAGTTWVFTTEESTISSDVPSQHNTSTDAAHRNSTNVTAVSHESNNGGLITGGGSDLSVQRTVRRRGSGQQLLIDATAMDGDYDDVMAELDEFERQTGGEHYDRRQQQQQQSHPLDTPESAQVLMDNTAVVDTIASASTLDAMMPTGRTDIAPPPQDAVNVTNAAAASTTTTTTGTTTLPEDDLDQFMDEFEQYTGGEDFRRTLQ